MDRILEERIMKGLMIAALVIVVGSLASIIAIIVWQGLPGLSIEMLTQLPQGGYYTNTGGGGILNAIIGSLCLAFASSVIALVISIPVAFALQKDYLGRTKWVDYIRLALDVLWGARIPPAPGLGSRALLAHRGQGKVKALWLSRYDPTNAALLGDVASQLRQLDLLVVQHLFMTECGNYAHVVLPTTAFGEEEVTFTSTDRRIQLAERVVDPPSGLTPAWEQIVQLARLMGADWKYAAARDVMDEIRRVVPFYSGADYENLARDYGRQWPCTKDRPLGTKFLFAENHFAEKPEERPFKFVAVPRPLAPKENPKEFPLTLVFGNSLYYWNQNVLVRHSETLKREYRQLMIDYPDGFVEMNPEDAKQFGIRDGKRMRLCAAAASSAATARITAEVRTGTIFVPHFMRAVEQQILGSSGDSLRLVPVRVEKGTV